MVKIFFALSFIIHCGSALAQEFNEPVNLFTWHLGDSVTGVDSNTSSVYEWYAGEKNCYWGGQTAQLTAKSNLNDPCSWTVLSGAQSPIYYRTMPSFEPSFELMKGPSGLKNQCLSEGHIVIIGKEILITVGG